jgi:hypothetical protein
MTLDPEYSAFAQSGVAIDVAGRDAHNVPVVARAIGCRVSTDRQRITVFVPRTSSTRFLDAVASTGAVAAVFCHPSTVRSIQLKGSDATLVPASDEDRGPIRATIEGFVADVGALGLPESVARLEVSCDFADLVGVAFTIDAAFVQTPGANAGTRI